VSRSDYVEQITGMIGADPLNAPRKPMHE